MKPYEVIFFDLDDTLLDYQNAEANVMKKLFAYEKKAYPAEAEKELWDMQKKCSAIFTRAQC